MRTMFHGSNAQTFRYAKELRQGMTGAEKLLWDRLSGKQLSGFRFKRQHPIKNYIADFYCHKAKLIIEVDGGIHDNPEQVQRDEERTAELEKIGCRVLRFTNLEVQNRIDEVINVIKQQLSE